MLSMKTPQSLMVVIGRYQFEIDRLRVELLLDLIKSKFSTERVQNHLI